MGFEMQAMIRALSASLLCVLSGCATTAKFTAKMDGYVGQPEAVVVARYGVPAGTYALQDGSKIIEFTRGGRVVIPGPATYEPVTTNTTGNITLNQGIRQTTGAYSQQSTTYVTQQAAPTVINTWCTVRFTVSKDGLISAWSAEGNNCVSN